MPRRKNARYDILNIRPVRSADILPSRAAESFDTAFWGDRPGQYAIFRQRFNRCIITARREKSPAVRDFFTSDVLFVQSVRREGAAGTSLFEQLSGNYVFYRFGEYSARLLKLGIRRIRRRKPQVRVMRVDV